MGLKKLDLRVRIEKCEFFTSSVTYLGHKIDGNGLHPLLDKVGTVQNSQPPTNVITFTGSF